MVVCCYYFVRFFHECNSVLFLMFLLSGCQFKTSYGMKDMERHLRTHTGFYSCFVLLFVGFLFLAPYPKAISVDKLAKIHTSVRSRIAVLSD